MVRAKRAVGEPELPRSDLEQGSNNNKNAMTAKALLEHKTHVPRAGTLKNLTLDDMNMMLES